MNVLIVGAGPNGLSAARACRTFGVSYDQVERHTDVGGIWDRDNEGSPIYESAHFISSKTMSGFLGFPMPDDYPDYPGRQQILDYLRAFADRFNLKDGIRFGTSVTHATPRANNTGWHVTFSDASSSDYDAIICCTGTQWLPVMPTYPGTFSGELRHSSTYWSGDELRGKRVLVIGGGNSGFDIACDAAKFAANASLSLRRGYWVIPKHIFGQPSDVFADSGPHIPNRIAQPLLGKLLRFVAGKQERLGLPKPDHKIMATHPVLNTQIFHFLSHGDLTIRKDVARFDGETVHFVDGTSADFDIVLCATGYRHEVPFLPAGTLPTTANGRPRLASGVFVPGRLDVFVPGMFETNSGGYHLYDRLNALAVQALRDSMAPDSATMSARIRREAFAESDLHGGIRFVDSPRHEDYVDSIALQKRISAVFKTLGWLDPTDETYTALVGR
jgi:hypothetical protein